MLRNNITLHHKVKANQSDPQSKHLNFAQFIEEESLQEKMDRFFQSINDMYQQPSPNQVSETCRQTHGQQINDQISIQSKDISDDYSDDYNAYRAEIDFRFKRLESICEQLQPLQQITDTPTNMTDTPTNMTDTPTTYTPAIYTTSMYMLYTSSCMPAITLTPINYSSHHCIGETDNNYHHTDHEHHVKYVLDV